MEKLVIFIIISQKLYNHNFFFLDINLGILRFMMHRSRITESLRTIYFLHHIKINFCELNQNKIAEKEEDTLIQDMSYLFFTMILSVQLFIYKHFDKKFQTQFYTRM